MNRYVLVAIIMVLSSVFIVTLRAEEKKATNHFRNTEKSINYGKGS